MLVGMGAGVGYGRVVAARGEGGEGGEGVVQGDGGVELGKEGSWVKCLSKGAISVRGGRQFFMVQVAVTGWGSLPKRGAAVLEG